MTSTLMVFAAGPLGGPGEEMPGCSVHSAQMLLAGRCCAAYGDGMASDPQMELRLTRLENDSNSIYDLITGISSTQQEHSRRFDAVDGRFDSVEATLAEVVRRIPEPS
jgi:hypothetical protein